MTKFKHIIITRFNLPQRWNEDKQGNVVLDTIWLKDRFNLFQNFCLPSITGQSSKNFEWWIYFDVNTEILFKKVIENLEDKYPYFKAKYEKSYDSFESNMPTEIFEDLNKTKTDWLITTRLDNDDMLAKNTIRIIQEKCNFQKNMLLEIPCGYTLELGIRSKLRKVSFKLNPFISYVEKVEKEKVVKSVYFYQHTDWRNVETMDVTDSPQWTQIIHNRNVINGINGDLVLPLNFYSRFIFNRKALNLKIPYKFLVGEMINKLKNEPYVRRIMILKKFLNERNFKKD